MPRISDLFIEGIERAERRFQGRRAQRERNLESLHAHGDWREFESPQRVHHRLCSLNLQPIAAELMGSPDPVRVESARRRNTEVSLLERILEESDLIASRYLHAGSAAAGCVGRVLIRNGHQITGYGTGFMVSPELMLTNNHVLKSARRAADSTFQLDYYERRDGQLGPSHVLHLDPERFFLTDRDLDFTLVAVRDPLGVLAGRRPIRLIAESGKALIGEPVNIIQHPAGRPQEVALTNNRVVDIVDAFLHYTTDTEPGSSGSPVLNGQWELAALHHSGVPQRDGQDRILLRDGSVWDGGMATAGLINWVANEGVRISAIVRFVREALADAPEWLALFEQATSGDGVIAAGSPPPAASGRITAPAGGGVGLSTAAPEADDAALDRLTPTEIEALHAELERDEADLTAESAGGVALVAEGDSWFDYRPAGLDIIYYLRSHFGHRIRTVADAGDTLDNMAWGTEYNRRWKPDKPPLQRTLEAVREHQPRVVLLSGGGNDVAGDELFQLLNHRDSGLPPLREDFARYLIGTYYRAAFTEIMRRIWEVDANIQFITHGYGHPVPDGRAVINVLGFRFGGPWLRPALTAKGYTDATERREIVEDLVNRLNDMLAGLAAGDARVHYLDLRPVIGYADWVNELHLRNTAYKRVAAVFDRRIRDIVA